MGLIWPGQGELDISVAVNRPIKDMDCQTGQASRESSVFSVEESVTGPVTGHIKARTGNLQVKNLFGLSSDFFKFISQP